ncbi:MgtC/SapB family protein [Brucella pseudogrignonensis]|jgi:putative Mg2+ transporter-C (MgtC) family protein|uniref:Protein MgtC n=1 Tax=Brucella pseudogrignonensis TaxID=419475 RepID=A0A256G2U7_9HYPH|nr:MgtC/SapB family protein [Brucella pseudogrignonensis]EMG52350.1 MgtC/SapB transporter [Ochrobactrum sp. CDB2]MCD4513347.1 MgtC/SapB family protein [Brucella pseudogrignonensis]MCM0752113.1 MgtC/SapB family protein [Brucella pseudogrignonensis]NKX16589.1 MgtC/SapB family protein [Brucella pseudogrignonensis]NNV19736.1 MgtC/SapB family protein [Brucella pseudogrignonensis]
MQFVNTFDLYPFLDTAVSFTAAFIFGTMIGAERQYRQRTAGLRTNALVALGAAAFVDLAARLAGSAEALRVIAYVVSGVGFLGAGVIMKEGMNVRGLNTAATLWCSAAVGACAGTDMLAEAALLTLYVLLGNTLLRPLVNLINRIPIDEQALEQTYEVRVIASHQAMEEMRKLLVEKLDEAKYPVGDVEITDRNAETVEILATLVSTSIDPEEIDAVTHFMEKQPGVFYAGWEGSSKD